MESLRQTMLTEAEMLNSRRRFGLFSQPTTLALGDNSLFPSKTARKGQDGKPVSMPRNMLAGPNRSGISKKDFLEAPSSIHAGDKYLDPEKIEHHYNQKIHGKSKLHEATFKPNSYAKTLGGSSYRYMEEKPRERIRPARDETGRVITKDKNITSNPITRVQSEFFKAPKHIIDPYERKDQLASQERKLNDQKKGEQIFRSMSHGNILFGTHQQIYGIDAQGHELLKSKKSFVEGAPHAYKHESAFKLARRGHGDPIGKYPEFIASVSESVAPKVIKKEKSDKEGWKHVGNRSLSRPTPSISLSSFSLRKHR